MKNDPASAPAAVARMSMRPVVVIVVSAVSRGGCPGAEALTLPEQDTAALRVYEIGPLVTTAARADVAR
jgi:hypothetical protein